MPKRSSNDLLDEAVEALMAETDAASPQSNARIDPLLRIAADLRDLPRPDFKVRLAAALVARAGGIGPAPEKAPLLAPRDLGALLRNLPELVITDDTTGEEADAAVRSIGWMNDRLLGVMRFSGRTPWERHPGGDEMLHILDGEVQITVMTADGPVEITATAPSVFICPQGLWHRQYAPNTVTVLYGTPVETSEISFAEDPRQES